MKLRHDCYGEWCWIQQDFVKKLNDNELKGLSDQKHLKRGIKRRQIGYQLVI